MGATLRNVERPPSTAAKLRHPLGSLPLRLRRFGRRVRSPVLVQRVLRVQHPVSVVVFGAFRICTRNALGLLSRTPTPCLGVSPMPLRQTGTRSPLLLESVHHVLDRLELAGGRLVTTTDRRR